MKINEAFINNIFNYKIKLKNEKDKIKLSSYTELIPMYDIYTQQIYPIKKENIYHRLIDSNYRFINTEVKNWITIQYDKFITKLKKMKTSEEKTQMENSIDRFKNMIDIINNYHIDTLIDTSYRVLYKYSGIGLSISICKRNSFHPFILYLKPYYTKTELIKLGQNMGILNMDIKPDILIDELKHYEVCKNISNNDVSFDEIKDNTLTIINKKTISDICFYSFIGAALLNKFLRTKQQELKINTFFYNRLKNIVATIKDTEPLIKDYQIYRFIADDAFLQDLKIGDIYTDKGFTSTTRDPFYSPGIAGNFGLVLIKINLNKNIKGSGLFIEHFSLFPIEEEYLLPPNTKLKLVSKDDKFKYYHVNANFEKIIFKKYEFDLISVDYTWIKDIVVADISIPVFSTILLESKTRVELFQQFKNITNQNNEIIVNDIIFNIFFFDSTGSYSRFYKNKVSLGLSLIHFDTNGYPLIFIELGTEMVVNFINQFYFYNEKNNIDEKKLIEIVLNVGSIFKYKQALIYNNYKNFYHFNKNYYSNQQVFLYLNHYDDTLYQYLTNNVKPYSFEPFYQNKFKDIDIILNKDNMKTKLIKTIETNFSQYNNLIRELSLDKLNFGILNINNKLVAEGKIDMMIDLDYNDEDKRDDLLNLIYRQPIRRI